MPTTRTQGPTARQREILDCLSRGMTAMEIAEEHGVTRNSVHLQIGKMRERGILPANFTPSGQPPRTIKQPGEETLAKLLSETAATNGDVAAAGAAALLLEIKRTRDQLDEISRRLSALVPR